MTVKGSDGSTTHFNLDGSMTVIDREGSTAYFDANGTTITDQDGSTAYFDSEGKASMAVLSDGTIMDRHSDGTWTCLNVQGQHLTWSDRDQTWIAFDPALHGSHWDHDEKTGSWTERSSPDPTRPQGVWVSPDGHMRITEINGNLFAQSGNEYLYRLGGPFGAEVKYSADGWLHVSREAYEDAQMNGREMEHTHATPELAANLAFTDALNARTASFIERFTNVELAAADLIPVVGTLKGLIEATTGVDLVASAEELRIEKVSLGERLLDLLPIVPHTVAPALGRFAELIADTRAAEALSDVERASWIEAAAQAPEDAKKLGEAAEAIDKVHSLDEVRLAFEKPPVEPESQSPLASGGTDASASSGIPPGDDGQSSALPPSGLGKEADTAAGMVNMEADAALQPSEDPELAREIAVDTDDPTDYGDEPVDIESASQDVGSATSGSTAGFNMETDAPAAGFNMESAGFDPSVTSHDTSQGYDPSQGFNMETDAAAAGFNMESAGFDPSVTSHDTSQGYDPSQGFNMETDAAAAGFNMESAGFDPSATGHDTSQGYDPSQGFNMETDAAAAGFNMESAGFDPSATGHDTSQGYDPSVTGHDTSQGYDPSVTGHDTSQGYDPSVTGHDTSQGYDPSVTGDDTSQGYDPSVTGDDTSQGYDPSVTGDDTSQGYDPSVTGDDTSQGYDPAWHPPR